MLFLAGRRPEAAPVSWNSEILTQSGAAEPVH
jgi:hypothetical protein